jgi:farnesyl-diphosphate farnesyltransferase
MVVSGESFCRQHLPQVSRTFALNIPVLPAPLDLAVTVAYLLCRIADTLEDETTGQGQGEWLDTLADLVALGPDWERRACLFAREAGNALRAQAPEPEARLLAETATVLGTLAVLPPWTHPHIARCVRIMTAGMKETQTRYGARGGVEGLPDLRATFLYCYHVAGVVGEMLTGLFVDGSPRAAARHAELAPRAVAFGRALQLTNILKDVREDLDRGSCWLPRDMMAAHGLEPALLASTAHRARAVALMGDLVAVSRESLAEGLEYALALPTEEPPLRLFCLYPLFFSVMTLNLVEDNPAVFEPRPVKLRRETVGTLMRLIQERVSSDAALRELFATCSEGKRGAEVRL